MTKTIPEKEHLEDFLEYITENFFYSDNRGCWVEIGNVEDDLEYSDVIDIYFKECNFI